MGLESVVTFSLIGHLKSVNVINMLLNTDIVARTCHAMHKDNSASKQTSDTALSLISISLSVNVRWDRNRIKRHSHRGICRVSPCHLLP